MDVAPVDGYPRGDGPPADRPPSHPSVYLALGVHDHQPVGNFDWVLREHFEKAYRPFLESMERHPSVPFSLHITGPLLLWLVGNEPRFMSRLRALVDAGRVELKAGGFYEPILALIPEADAHEQLRRMRRFLQEELGALPTGAWPAERVWEPHLARVLADAGLEYAVLDDSHFQAAGVPPEGTHGYYVTEEQGRRFDLFPISKELRYLIPFREPEDTLDFLRTLAGRWREQWRHGGSAPDTPPPLAVYDDDGEKFGGWPGTHAHVYEAGWLERFLTALEVAVDEGWLGLLTLGEYRRLFPPLGRVYLPTASYAEMLEWSHGFFRTFLVRYEEANLLHKRMLYTGRRVRHRLAALGCAPGRTPVSAPCRQHDPRSRSYRAEAAPGGETRGGPGALELRDALRAYDHLLQAQCNDALWHGVFGGLYLPHLRDGISRNLLHAERLLGRAAGPPLEVLDLDLDGHDEVVLRTDDVVVVVAPARGGTLLSIDHLPSGYALLNTLRRRREPEHAALAQLAAPAAGPDQPAPPGDPGGSGSGESPDPRGGARTIHETVRMKEPGLERLLFEDRLPRTGFTDRFLPARAGPDATLEALVTGTLDDAGDFSTAAYAFESPRQGPRTPDGRPGILLRRRGTVAGHEVSLEKSVRLEAGADRDVGTTLEVDYRVTVHAPDPALDTGCPPQVHGAVASAAEESARSGTARFGPEVTINLLAGWEPDRYVVVDGSRPEAAALADAATHPEAGGVDLVDDHAGLAVGLSWSAELTAGSAVPRPVPATLFRYGVVTVSQSEDGFERVYQGTALLPTWELPLVPAAVLTARVRVEIVGPDRAPEDHTPTAGPSDPPSRP